MRNVLVFSTVLLLFPVFGQALAKDLDRAELERWLESDEVLPKSISTDHVNEGQLAFLSQSPKKIIHHHQNLLVINASSLETGWVELKQCHENLDRVPRTQITYNKKRVQDLELLEQQNIEHSWIEANTLQLRNIQSDARVCVAAKTRALSVNSDGSYSLRNGPFMRRFLDGYYPLWVSLEVDYRSSGLELVAMQPQAQTGFAVTESEGKIQVDALFEGQLRTEFNFRPK